MYRVKNLKARYVPISIMLAFLFGGCVYDPHYNVPPPSARHYYDPYDYYYYPGVNVYFHFTTGFYYYHDRTRWIRTHILPPHIYIYPHDRVRIKIKSKEPYLRHNEHKERYTPRPMPKYKIEKKSSIKEREENRMLHDNYKKNRDKSGRRKDKRKR